MSIPDIEPIRTFLQMLSLSKPSGAGFAVQAFTQRIAQDESLGLIQEAPISLWYRTLDGFSLESLIERVRKELDNIGHPATREISLIAIGLFLVGSSDVDKTTSSLNDFVNLAAEFSLTQIYAMPFKPPANVKQFEFGSFTVGRSNAESVKQLTLRAGSQDFFELHGGRFRNAYCIQRRDEPCVALNFWKYFEMLPSTTPSEKFRARQSEDLSNRYFSEMSKYYAERFWKDFDEQQQLQVCFGAPYLGLRQIQQIPNAMMLSVYLLKGSAFGYVAPQGQLLSIDLVSADTIIPDVLSSLRKTYGFTSLGDSNVDKMIRHFTEFMYRGRLRQLDQDYSEAFLSYIISLDLLFGERDSSVDSMCRRVAVLTYRNLGLHPGEAIAKVKKLYDVRSRYVHAGVGIDKEQVEQIERICKAVLSALMRVRRLKPLVDSDVVVEEWLKELDFIWHAHEVKRPVSDLDLAALGIS